MYDSEQPIGIAQSLSFPEGWRTRIRRLGQQHPTALSLLIALLFGTLIEFLIIPHALHNTKYVRQLGDRIADSMIRLAGKVAGLSPSAVPFVFVDIDNKTWRDWRTPLIVPRQKLADILSKVSKSGPRVIIVDVNLAWLDPDGAGQRALEGFLQDYPAEAPPLILLRSGIGAQSDSRYPYERPTPLDEIIARRFTENPAPVIQWATAYFDVDPDSMVRRWRLAEIFCRNGSAQSGPATPIVLPSVYLAAASLAAHPDAAGQAARALDRELQKLAPEGCEHPPKAAIELEGLPRPVVVGAGAPGNRIVYSIGWEEDRLALGPYASVGSERTPLVSVRPAAMVLAGRPGVAIDGLQDRIVIVGGSYADSGDLHRTPLGVMPGALLIANATQALIVNGTPEEPAWYWRIALSFGLVMANGLLFHNFRFELATAAALGLLLVLMIVTVPLFASGIILDWEVPSLGILVHRYFGSLERTLRHARHEGWRSLIRSH